MGTTNYGNQTVSVQFFAPADAKVVNKRQFAIRPKGIYVGGYLSKVTDAIVEVSPLMVEIGDNDHQVKVTTADSALIAVGSSTPYIVLRWGYVESNLNYMDMLALDFGSIVENDMIVGKCIYAGGSLVSFDYVQRANPDVLDVFLKVESTVPASMNVRIRAGRVNYGISNFDVIDQLSPIFAAPSVNPRVDVIYVDNDGLVKVYSGMEGYPPVPPVYNSKKVLAEIMLQILTTEITADLIKDVRSWL